MQETNIKVRLVGATVLVSLAVIFIPMILDGRETSEVEITESNIPPKPERDYISKIIPLTPTVAVKPVTTPKLVVKKGLSAQVTPEKVDSPKLVKQKKAQKTAAVKTASPVKSKPVQKLRPGLNAWAVQVGSFSSKKNAYALEQKLRKKGFTAFVDTIYVKDIASFRVRVGPEVKRESAESIRKKIAGFYRGRTFIVKHPS